MFFYVRFLVGIGKSCKFCFESTVWQSIFNRIDGDLVVLDKVFRQKDSAFVNLLNDMRRGVVSHSSAKLLEAKVIDYQRLRAIEESSKKDNGDGGISLKSKYTKLFSTNRDVDQINEEEFKKLSDPVVYCAEDGNIDEAAYNTLKSGTKAPETLRLAVGAQV